MRMLVLVLVMAALACAAVPVHADSTDASLSVEASGDGSVLKNLKICVEVRDYDSNRVITRCEWDGEHNRPGTCVHSSSHLNWAVRNYEISLTIYYKDREVVGETTYVHVDPGRLIEVEFHGQRYVLGGRNSSMDLPEINVVRNIEGATVRVLFKPVVKLLSSYRVSINEHDPGETKFEYTIDNGLIEISGRDGHCKIAFSSDVKIGVNPLTLAFGALALPLARCLFRRPRARVPDAGQG
ncbi:hypothetical protein [Methanopyrus sp.]